MRRDKLAPGRPEARRARAARATHRCPAPLPLLSLQPVALFSQLFLRASTQAEAKGCLVPCPLNRTPSTQLPFRGPVHRKATGFHSGTAQGPRHSPPGRDERASARARSASRTSSASPCAPASRRSPCAGFLRGDNRSAGQRRHRRLRRNRCRRDTGAEGQARSAPVSSKFAQSACAKKRRGSMMATRIQVLRTTGPSATARNTCGMLSSMASPRSDEPSLSVSLSGRPGSTKYRPPAPAAESTCLKSVNRLLQRQGNRGRHCTMQLHSGSRKRTRCVPVASAVLVLVIRGALCKQLRSCSSSGPRWMCCVPVSLLPGTAPCCSLDSQTRPLL